MRPRPWEIRPCAHNIKENKPTVYRRCLSWHSSNKTTEIYRLIMFYLADKSAL